MDMTSAFQAIKAWPVNEQIEFVQRVWDYIVESGWQPALTDEQKAELDRRVAAHTADPTHVFSWSDVVKQVRRLT